MKQVEMTQRRADILHKPGSSPTACHQLPQEEMRSHQPAPTQEEAEVETGSVCSLPPGRKLGTYTTAFCGGKESMESGQCPFTSRSANVPSCLDSTIPGRIESHQKEPCLSVQQSSCLLCEEHHWMIKRVDMFEPTPEAETIGGRSREMKEIQRETFAILCRWGYHCFGGMHVEIPISPTRAHVREHGRSLRVLCRIAHQPKTARLGLFFSGSAFAHLLQSKGPY